MIDTLLYVMKVKPNVLILVSRLRIEGILSHVL